MPVPVADMLGFQVVEGVKPVAVYLALRAARDAGLTVCGLTPVVVVVGEEREVREVMHQLGEWGVEIEAFVLRKQRSRNN